MSVTSRLIACVALCFVCAMSMGSAQNTLSYDRSTGLPTATVPNDNTSSDRPPVATARKKPGVQQEARPPYSYATNPLNYRSNPSNYLSNASRLRTRNIDPAMAAAQHQSGLNQADATSLMRTQGYTQLGDVRADPNSNWVWQADAMKNGRRVHLGIDHRGNLSDISAGQTQPCTSPGVGLGAGPMGVGSRLSGVATCRQGTTIMTTRER